MESKQKNVLKQNVLKNSNSYYGANHNLGIT